MRPNTTPCKRPGKDVSKEAKTAAHRAKVMGKFFRRQERGVTFAEREIAAGKHARPNMSDRTLRAHTKKGKK